MISRGEPKVNRAKFKKHKLTFPVVLQPQWEISCRPYQPNRTQVLFYFDLDLRLANP